MVHRYGYGRNNVKELQRTSNMVARSSVDTVLFFFYNLQKKKIRQKQFFSYSNFVHMILRFLRKIYFLLTFFLIS